MTLAMRPIGPYGFQAVSHMAGGVPGRTGAVEYTIATGESADIMSGDMVKSTGTGRNVTLCAAGENYVGIFLGCEYREPDGEVIFRNYWPGGQATQSNTTIKALVIDDPNLNFEAQMNGALAAADVGQLVDLVQTSAPNLQAGVSGQQLDSASIGASGQFKIVALSPKYQSNMSYGDNNDVYVVPVAHELALRAAV